MRLMQPQRLALVEVLVEGQIVADEINERMTSTHGIPTVVSMFVWKNVASRTASSGLSVTSEWYARGSAFEMIPSGSGAPDSARTLVEPASEYCAGSMPSAPACKAQPGAS